MSGFDFCDFHPCGRAPIRRRSRQSSRVRNIQLSNVRGRHLATPDHENGWPTAAVRQLGYAPVCVIQFSKISETLPPTPYDENGRLPYCTSNSIYEAKNQTQLPFRFHHTPGELRYELRLLDK